MESFKPRFLLEEILSLWGKKKIFVVRGPRRSGKTTLLRELHRRKGGTYITMEDPKERGPFLHDPLAFVKSYDPPLFLDEIQYLGERGAQALKLIYDEADVKLVVSGSGAFDVSMSLFRYLVGRAYTFTLLPLSFGEYVAWKSRALFALYRKGKERVKELIKGGNDLPDPLEGLRDSFALYSVFGGYPEVVLEGQRELTEIVSSTVEEDIIRFFGLREGDKVWAVLMQLSAIAGNIFHPSAFPVTLKTLEGYVAIFQRSFILKLLPAFSPNPNVEIRKAKKVYFYDNGFRNALIGNLSLGPRPDMGALWENAVYRQLLEWGYPVYYWRTKNKAEVDFVVKTPEGPIPVEVKRGPSRVTRSLVSFVKRYRPPVAFVATPEPFEREVEGVPIYGVPPYYL